VFEFMADGERLGEWSFGCWQTKLVPGDVFSGTSLMTGAATFVRIHADAARMRIDYDVGRSADALSPLIMARVVPGAMLGETDAVSFLSLIAWRGVAPEERWRQICAAHELEMFRIRHLIENDA
jgi:hypothetical protein